MSNEVCNSGNPCSKKDSPKLQRGLQRYRQRKKRDEEAMVILCLLQCHLSEGKYIRVILMRGEKNTVKKV